MGLRSKFLVILLVLIVLPMVSLGGLSFWVFNQWSFDSALERMRDVGEGIAASFASDMQLERSNFRSFKQSVFLVSSVRNLFSNPTTRTTEAVRSELKQFLDATPNMIEIGVYDPQGRLAEASIVHSDHHRKYIGFPSIMPPVQWGGQEMKLEPIHIGGEGKVFRVYLKIIDERKQLVGYVASHSQARVLSGLLNNNVTDSMFFFVSDASGNLLVKSPNLHLESVPKAWWDVVAAQEKPDEFHQVELNEKPFLLSMMEVRPGLWAVSLLNIESVYQQNLNLLMIIMPIVIMLIVFSALFFYLRLSNLIIYPIEKLIRATKKISSGDFRPNIDISTVDEVGELAQAFRSMGQQLKASGEKIRQLAFYDPLTHLPNRETLLFSLNNQIEASQRNNSLLGVMFIDLDDFKKVNDRLGHAAGDQLLVVIGERLTNCLRSCDLVSGATPLRDDEKGMSVSRRGGDEFNAVVSNAKSARDIALIAERLITDINEPIVLNDNPIGVGASIGIAIYPYDGKDAETLLHNADLAMYEAKAMGKNNYFLFTESINTQVHERLEMEQRIRMALQHSEFELFFQPKIVLTDMAIAGLEALIRWKNPDGEWISPAEFIPLAEESQLIHDIGRWVIAEAFDHARKWDQLLPLGVRVAVNISARQLAQENFAENFISMAQQFGAPLERMEIELTETSILSDEKRVVKHLHRLRGAGVKVSLDDFGTGYSSLTFLRSLPIDAVKIDRSFVSRLEEDKESREIIASVLDLCKKLSLETIAEGIETESQAGYLIAHGCTEGQGYLFSRPIPADEVLGYLTSSEYISL